MLRLLCPRSHKYPVVQLSSYYSTKKPAGRDASSAVPNECDVLVIGGGAMGSSIAYWCKRLVGENTRVVVVERDPTYKIASTVLSLGGLRQQFSCEENIKMSLFGADFLTNINEYLHVEGEPLVDAQFHQHGYLSLCGRESAHILKKNSELQNSLGARNVLLSQDQLKAKFPWLNVTDVELGCHGLEKEGWFDPWSLLLAFKRKALAMGVVYVQAEAKSFKFQLSKEMVLAGGDKNEEIKSLVVETEDGRQSSITFDKCVIAAGAFSANVAQTARIGLGHNLLSVPLPVEPRKRYVFCLHAPDGPGQTVPLTVDPTRAYFRPEGSGNSYVCGLCPTELEEPPVDNLEVDHEYFDSKLWPILANRVPAFENIKVKSSWAGYYEYNTFDENGIIGRHPHHRRIFFATGFSGHGIQQSPAVGRAISELIAHGSYRTIDLSRLGFDRFVSREPMREANIW